MNLLMTPYVKNMLLLIGWIAFFNEYRMRSKVNV